MPCTVAQRPAPVAPPAPRAARRGLAVRGLAAPPIDDPLASPVATTCHASFVLLALFDTVLAGSLCDAAIDSGWREVGGALVEPRAALDYEVNLEALQFLGRVIDALRARGVRVVVALVPERTHTVVASSPEGTASASWLAEERHYQALLSYFRDHGALAPDLGAVAREATSLGLDFYRPDDGHWSSDGGVMAAEELARQLLAEKAWSWAGSKPTELLVRSRTEPDFSGWHTKEVVKLCGREAVDPPAAKVLRARTPQLGSESLLTDLPAPPVVVVGSSFARPGSGFPQALAATLDADVLTVAIVSGRVVTPMRAWLATADLEHAAPEVLVWVLPTHHLFGPATPPQASLHSGTGFRLLLPMFDEGCTDHDAVRLLPGDGRPALLSPSDPPVPSRGHYLQFSGGNALYAKFGLELDYADGTRETVTLAPDDRLDAGGRLAFELRQDTEASLVGLSVRASGQDAGLEGSAVRVCRYR